MYPEPSVVDSTAVATTLDSGRGAESTIDPETLDSTRTVSAAESAEASEAIELAYAEKRYVAQLVRCFGHPQSQEFFDQWFEPEGPHSRKYHVIDPRTGQVMRACLIECALEPAVLRILWRRRSSAACAAIQRHSGRWWRRGGAGIAKNERWLGTDSGPGGDA